MWCNIFLLIIGYFTVGHLCQYLEMVHSDVASINNRRFEILVKHSSLDDPQVCWHDNKLKSYYDSNS